MRRASAILTSERFAARGSSSLLAASATCLGVASSPNSIVGLFGAAPGISSSSSIIATATASSATGFRCFSTTRPLFADPGKKRGYLENFWEVNRRVNVITMKEGRPQGPTVVNKVWAEVRAIGDGYGPIPKDGEAGGSSSSGGDSSSQSGAEPSASAGVVGSSGPKPATFNLGIVLLVICSFDMYRRMFMRSTGNGELDYPYQPYTVVSRSDRAKQTVMNLLWPTEAEKEGYKTGFFLARRQRPLLTFWQYMDESHPGWSNGNSHSSGELMQAMQGAVSTSTEYQFVNLTNKLHSLTANQPNSQSRVDIIVEHLRTLHADNPAMKLAATMAGAQGQPGGGMPVMRMQHTADGRMVLVDQQGNQIPVQSMQSLAQSGGLTFQPTGRVADGGSMPQMQMGGGNPMILSGAPPGSTITTIPMQGGNLGSGSNSDSSAPAEAGGDHGTVPMFKS